MLKYGLNFFSSDLVVRHKDGNHHNNSWDNILLGTRQENSLDIPKQVRQKSAEIASQKSRDSRKYKDDVIKDLFIDRYVNKFLYKDLAVKYGIPKSSLSFLFRNSIFSKENKYMAY